jgi:hypothetical protein
MKEPGGFMVGNLFNLKVRARQASLSKQRGFAALAARRYLQGGFACHGCGLALLLGKNLPSSRVHPLIGHHKIFPVLVVFGKTVGISLSDENSI